nr:hypothetical protein [Clostridioides sp.]
MEVELKDVQVLINRASYWMNKGHETLEAIIKAEIDLEGEYD